MNIVSLKLHFDSIEPNFNSIILIFDSSEMDFYLKSISIQYTYISIW